MAKSWSRMTVDEKMELLREELAACKTQVHQLAIFMHDVKSRVDRVASSVDTLSAPWIVENATHLRQPARRP